MATFPSTTSARASYQRDSGRPMGSRSCTRQVNLEPSGALQWGSTRLASQNNNPATPTSTMNQNTVSIAHQHARRRWAGAVATAALVGLLAACSSGTTSSSGPTSAATATTATPATTAALPTTTTLSTGAADLGPPNVSAATATSASGTGDLDPALRAQVIDAIHTYENAASGTPLGTGAPAVLDGVLTTGAAARLTSATRDALTDEGLPALAAVKADEADVTLDAFTGPDQTMVVNATIDQQLSASTPGGGPVKIVRNGTLTFVNDGGSWKIDAFNLSVQRDVP